MANKTESDLVFIWANAGTVTQHRRSGVRKNDVRNANLMHAQYTRRGWFIVRCVALHRLMFMAMAQVAAALLTAHYDCETAVVILHSKCLLCCEMYLRRLTVHTSRAINAKARVETGNWMHYLCASWSANFATAQTSRTWNVHRNKKEKMIINIDRMVVRPSAHWHWTKWDEYNSASHKRSAKLRCSCANQKLKTKHEITCWKKKKKHHCVHHYKSSMWQHESSPMGSAFEIFSCLS